MVLDTHQADVGAAIMALWTRVDGVVCNYRCQFWYGILQSIHSRDSVDRGFAFCAQSAFQLCFHTNTIWPEKQSSRSRRYLARRRDARLGVIRIVVCLAGVAMGRLRQYSVSLVGHFCYVLTAHYHVFEQIMSRVWYDRGIVVTLFISTHIALCPTKQIL